MSVFGDIPNVESHWDSTLVLFVDLHWNTRAIVHNLEGTLAPLDDGMMHLGVL